MNKMKQKIAAALLAAACIPLTPLTAGAQYCETDWSYFTDLVEFDDHGMLHGANDPDSRLFIRTYLNHSGEERYLLVKATPIPNLIRFMPRETLTPEVADEIAETLDPVFPGLHENVEIRYFGDTDTEFVRTYRSEQATLGFAFDERYGRMIHLNFKEEPEHAAELEASILLALAKKHLISEFYGFGQTVLINDGDMYCGGDYYTTEELENPDEATLARLNRDASPLGCVAYIAYATPDYSEVLRVADLDAIQAYLDEKYPGFTLETFETVPFPYRGKDGVETMITQPRFRIAGAEELSFVKQVELVCELWETFDLPLGYGFNQSSSETGAGNALKKPGDVTLDTDITIVDVIALNRNIMTGDPLCETAKLNADLNGNGTPDETDSLNLLKYIVGINETLG
ncbi:MAG: dockerin type I repeat-containing protein [Oscillospiraceae bacterium]|nr:dockerin type I repeat-containing protein [Oscillospiraceae bacterium]